MYEHRAFRINIVTIRKVFNLLVAMVSFIILVSAMEFVQAKKEFPFAAVGKA